MHVHALCMYMQMEIVKGWASWLALYLDQLRHRRMMQAAAGRLMKPALAACLASWRSYLHIYTTARPHIHIYIYITNI